VWGWTFTVVKDAVAVYGVVGFLAVRFTIAAVVLAPVAARRLSLRTIATGAGIGAVLAAAYLFQTSGLKYTTATNSGLITGLFVVVAPLVNRAVFGVKTRAVHWAAVAVSLAGLGLLTGAGPSPANFGDLLTLGCAGCFGLHIVLLDRLAKGHDTTALAAAQLGTAALVFLAIWPAAEPLDWPGREVWWALAVCGLLATAGGFWAQTFVQQRLPAVRTAVILTTEPVFATFFGYVLAGERLTGVQIAGAAVMVAAVVTAEAASAASKGNNNGTTR
jgi:drug/metabolite transporter (DMT)-like permease